MRYTEEKETKKSSFSQAVTARIRWDKSAYSSFPAICKTASFSSGKSLWMGLKAPGFLLCRLLPSLRSLSQRTTLRRLILNISQERVAEIPSPFPHSIISRMSNFCASVNHLPFISPTNPHRFFSQDRQFDSLLSQSPFLFFQFAF